MIICINHTIPVQNMDSQAQSNRLEKACTGHGIYRNNKPD